MHNQKNGEKLMSDQINLVDGPRVLILLTIFKDPPLLGNILECLKRTEYSNFEILFVDCESTRSRQLIELARLPVRVHYFRLEEDKGAAYQLNQGMRLAVNMDTKYVVRLEGDAIPQESGWLKVLVNVMEDDETVALAMPFDVNRNGEIGYGGRLYGNGTYCIFSGPPPSDIVASVGTGGHCYITRKGYLRELVNEGIDPYWEPFNISSEDLDFNLKAWLRSYRVVTVRAARVLHEGSSMPQDHSYRSSYRIYHMYKNRPCFLVFNFGYRHIFVNIWYRLLNDVLSAALHSELTLMLKGYLWIVTNLKMIVKERRLRMAHWKRITDRQLRDAVLVKLPMPLYYESFPKESAQSQLHSQTNRPE
jgi:GT2 family glycosyltransferase